MLTTVLMVCGRVAAVPAADPTAEDLASYEAARSGVGRDPKANVRLALWCEAHGLRAERLKHLTLGSPSTTTGRR